MFALASYYEPAGMVLLEAMSCGKPVVASSVGGIPEMLSPDCSITVPSRDHEAMGEGLIRVLSDAPLRRSMELAARDRAVRRFDWDVMTGAKGAPNERRSMPCKKRFGAGGPWKDLSWRRTRPSDGADRPRPMRGPGRSCAP